ncbi:MAG: hypothetical protein LUD47_06235 [Clostridia bacterium]|nr:hypothetical protein [Clostridia bacterium]
MKEALKVILQVIGTIALAALTVVAVPIIFVCLFVVPEIELDAFSFIGGLFMLIWHRA